MPNHRNAAAHMQEIRTIARAMVDRGEDVRAIKKYLRQVLLSRGWIDTNGWAALAVDNVLREVQLARTITEARSP